MSEGVIREFFERQRQLIQQLLDEQQAFMEQWMVPQEREEDESSGSIHIDAAEPSDFDDFITLLKDQPGAGLRGTWFSEHWGKRIDVDNPFLWDVIIAANRLHIIPVKEAGFDTCSLCKNRVRCSYQVGGRLIGRWCCSTYISKILQLFGYIWNSAYVDPVIANMYFEQLTPHKTDP